MRYLKSYKIFESTNPTEKPDLPLDFIYGVSDILLDMKDDGYSYRLMYYTYSWFNVTNYTQDSIHDLINDGVKSVGVEFPNIGNNLQVSKDRDGYYEQVKKTMVRLFDYISDYPVLYGLHFDGPRRSREQIFLNNHNDIKRFVDEVKSNTDGMIELCLHQR